MNKILNWGKISIVDAEKGGFLEDASSKKFGGGKYADGRRASCCKISGKDLSFFGFFFPIYTRSSCKNLEAAFPGTFFKNHYLKKTKQKECQPIKMM